MSSSTDTIIARHDAHMTLNLPRFPIAMVRGEGRTLYDADGKAYLDLFAGFGAGVLGHCHPDLVEAVSEQARTLWHPGNLFHSEPQTLLAEAISRHGFGGRSFFCHSGADANEAAFKLARLYGRAKPARSGKRYKIIAALHSFHGRTFGTMVATGQKKVSEGYEPLLTGFAHVPYNDLPAVEQAIDDQTAAVIVEPIQGEGGIHVPSAEYLQGLRRLCDQRDLLLIFDEVWTGCGRTGRYFAHQHFGVEPDIMTLAKGVGGGLAVGVMCAKDRAAQYFSCQTHGGVAHATTLGGNCLSMAVAHRIFQVLERDGLVARAEAAGEAIMGRLRAFARSHPQVKQVRGRGLFIGIELDPAADGERKGQANEVVKACMARGVLLNATQATVLRLAPPVTITDAEIDQGLSVLEAVLAGR